MKNLKFLGVMFLALLAGCSKKESGTTVEYTIAKPITVSLTSVRDSIEVSGPKAIEESGKMYRYQDVVFVNDDNKGVHVIHGLNDNQFEKKSFIRIPGNNDVSVKGDFLYADSYKDLVVFDISDLNDIQLVTILENVFPSYYYPSAEGVSWYDVDGVDMDNEIIIGWELQVETYVIDDDDVFIDALDAGGSSDPATGTGGSLARFKIVNDHLYVVDISRLHVFEISNLSSPVAIGTEPIGWEIETIFNKDHYLYIGSSSGMFIYDITVPGQPTFVSNISHILGCDPVVVQDDYAYVTIRGGNFCGQDISQLDVIDISDKANPLLITSVEMEEPYGLGVRNEALYVSDGMAGVKLFNIADPVNIFLENQFEDVQILDIIPLENKLLMVGENTLHIYEYLDGDLSLIHSYNLN